MISVRNLTKIYKLNKKNNQQVVALNSVNIDFPDKGLVFLLGKSGSGKSTLLNTVGGLDTFNDGEIIIKGKSSKDFKQSDFDSYRNTFIGFIFQEYNILEEFSVGKNLALALELQGKKADKEAVEKLLAEVDLAGYYRRKPNQLSGGQKQRVAIARALIKDPEIIMADEPTGALDSTTGKQVMDTLKKLSKSKLVIIVSHDREFAEIYGDRIIELKDGNIIRDEVKTEIYAEKSISGVSFIDNKIIHIKKGQKILKEDLLKINKMILDNTHETDTIISFDDKSNDNVKKTAFITDDGNREVFKKTQDKDIIRTNHNPKDFKMIKSKLKFKDSLKMGASSLKHKPVRLIFTILLSLIAFTMFGVVNTFASFDAATSTYETVKTLNLKTLSISNQLDSYNVFAVTNNMINDLKTNNPNYNFYKVIATDESARIQEYSTDADSKLDYTTKRLKTSGIMAINETVNNEFGLEPVLGRIPENIIIPTDETYKNQAKYKEIAISYNLYESILNAYKDINSWNDLNEKTFETNVSNNYYCFKIVGVIKDDTTNLSEYTSLDGNNPYSKDRTKYEELDILMKYNLVNMCYVTEDVFNTLSKNYSPRNSYYQTYVDNENVYNYSIYFETSKADTYTLYTKSGIDKASLSGTQSIIPKNVLTSMLGIAEENLQAEIEKGLKVKIRKGYDQPTFVTVDVVGYSSNDSIFYISDELFNNNFVGSDYVITTAKNNNLDKQLINYLYNYNQPGVELKLQYKSTPVLNNFGGMIEEMSNILLYVAIGLAVFAGLMLMNFIATSISYKNREIGVLRAIGARSKDVFSIFFSESMIICLINFVLSAIASGVVCTIINNTFVNQLGISLTLLVFGIKQIVLIFAVAVLVAFVSSFFPVFKQARKNPIDSINNR